MEVLALAFFVLASLGYLLGEDIIDYIWAFNFLSTSILIILGHTNQLERYSISEIEVFVIYCAMNIFAVGSLFLFKVKGSKLKIEEIDQ